MAQNRPVDELFWNLNARTGPLVANVGRARGTLSKFASFMKTPIGAVTAFGAAATVAGIKATGMAADLDSRIREVATLLPETTAELEGLRDEIIALSTRVPEPPAQLTEGVYQAISAGAEDTAEALQIVEVSSKAAVAGLTDTGTAVDAITTVLNAYGLEAREATRISDVMFSCVPGDTRVLLSDGRYVRIDELSDTPEVVAFDGRSFGRATSEWIPTGERETLRVSTHLGREIEVTPEHPLLAKPAGRDRRSTKPPAWTRADQLSVGDRIAVPGSLPFFGDKDVPRYVSGFLGLWIAEGASKASSPEIGVGGYEAEVREWAKAFGCQVKDTSTDESVPRWMFTAGERGHSGDNPTIELLRDHGLWQTSCEEKRVPDQVFTWNRQSVAHFLYWLFSGDGWFSFVGGKDGGRRNIQLGYCSKSKRLVKDVSHLLTRFGVVGRIRPRHREWVVGGETRTSTAWVWETCRHEEIDRFLRFIGIDRPDSIELFEQYEPSKRLRSHGPAVYDKIVAIEDAGEQEVYDLCVPTLRNFVAEDVLAHNTVRAGKLRFDDIAGSIGDVATTANLAGVSFEELSAAMAGMTKAGVNASETTTALNRFLLQIVSGGLAEAADKAGLVGEEFTAAALRTKGLGEFMRDLRDATGGSIERLAEVDENIRSLRASAVLTGDAFDEFIDTIEDFEDSAGATQIAFEEMNGSLENQAQLLKNRLNRSMLDLGNRILPLVIRGFEKLNEVLPDASLGTQRIIDNIAELEELRLKQEAGLIITEEERERIDGAVESTRQMLETSEDFRREALARVNDRIAAELASEETNQDRLDLLNEQARALRKLLEDEESVTEETSDQNENIREQIDLVGDLEAMAEARRALEDEVTGLTVSRVDELRGRFEEIREQVEAAFEGMVIPPEVQESLDFLERQFVDLPPVVQRFREQVDALDEGVEQLAASGQFTAETYQAFQISVRHAREAIADQLDEVEEGTKRHEELAKLLERLDKILRDLAGAYDEKREAEEDSTDSAEYQNRELERTIRQAARLAGAFVNLAQAAGVFDDEAVQVANSLVSIGEGIAAISTGDVFSGAAGVVSGLANIFSVIAADDEPSPAEKRRLERLEANNRALERLRTSVDELADQIAGQPQIGQVAQALESARQEAEARFEDLSEEERSLRGVDLGRLVSEEFREELRQMGISFEQLQEIARSLGLEIEDLTFEQIRKLEEAIAEIDFEDLLSGFREQMDLLRREMDLFNVDDPVQELNRLIQIIAKFTDLPDIADLSGIDVGTAEGQEALREFIEETFRKLTEGELGVGDLGQLSARQLLDLLGQMEGTLDDLPDDMKDAAGEGTAEGFRESRTITEVTGSLLVSLLTTSTVLERRAARAAEEILALISGRDVTEIRAEAELGSAPLRPLLLESVDHERRTADAVERLLEEVTRSFRGIEARQSDMDGVQTDRDGPGMTKIEVSTTVAAGAIQVDASGADAGMVAEEIRARLLDGLDRDLLDRLEQRERTDGLATIR